MEETRTMSVSNLLSDLVLNDLKEMGIKHKDKKSKVIKISAGQPLFRQGLQYLKLSDAFLENGTVVQVPQFIVEACGYILDHCETEGIFRKAGSAAKQREIRKCLEAGQPLGKSHRVIDIANIVSYFFRELPEPLIPYSLHETLVRCLLTVEPNRVLSIQLTLLLIPPLTLQTLAYFMQFLHTITRHVSSNKMSAENLAIVIAPSVMPYRDINSVRFKNHIKLVELLIENASVIGTIPARVRERLSSKSAECLAGPSRTRVKIKTEFGCSNSSHKNKNRRSQLFSALKTKVGLTMSSADNLDCPTKLQGDNPDKTKETSARFRLMEKTHRLADPFNAFRTKKSEEKHLNIDLPGNRGPSHTGRTTISKNTVDRRWSLVTSGWSKYNRKENLPQNLNSSASEALKTDDKASQKDTLEPIATEASVSEAESLRSDHESIVERVASMEMLTPLKETPDFPFTSYTPSEAVVIDEQVFTTSAEICLKPQPFSERLKKRSIDTNSMRSPRKTKMLRKTETSRINRRNSCHFVPTTELTAKVPLAKSKISPTANGNRVVKQTALADQQKQKQKNQLDCDHWLPAETFFENLDAFESPEHKRTDHNIHKNQQSDIFKSVSYSMSKLPATSKINIPHTERRLRTAAKPISRNYALKLAAQNNMIVEDQGRASIARLRAENCGMVLARAKLFDEFNACT